MQPAARVVALVALVALAALSACGGGGDEPSAEDIEAQIATQLEEGGLPEDDAACVAGVIVDEIGVDELQDVDFSAEEPPADLQDDISAATLAAIDACGLAADGGQ